MTAVGQHATFIEIHWHFHIFTCHVLSRQQVSQGVHAGQVGQEEAGEQRHLFLTAGHLGIVRLWDSRSTVLLPLLCSLLVLLPSGHCHGAPYACFLLSALQAACCCYCSR